MCGATATSGSPTLREMTSSSSDASRKMRRIPEDGTDTMCCARCGMPLRYWLCAGLSLAADAVGLRLGTLLARHRGPVDPGDQDGRIDVQPRRELHDVVQTQVACASLDLPHKSPVHVGQLR